jgi:hypothetical protein
LWDPEIDFSGKRVLVIGSGATAATVIPAFAEKAAHVTMLQRSPTYFFCSENRNELADRLREIGIDEPTIHRVVRAQIMYDEDALTKRCLTEPDVVFEELKALIRQYAGEDFEFEPHFTPNYRVWQQRLAFCPEGDVFKAAAAGKLTVVTDTLDTFTETGVRTSSGEEIEADIIVAATGFRLSVMGDIPFEVDGRAVDWHDTVNYRGMMFTIRLFPGQLDTACRHAGRFRLRPAQPHGRDWCQAGRGRDTRSRPGHGDSALDRSGQLQSELSDAGHRSAAVPGGQAGMAAQSGLLERERGDSVDRS